jgi:hypothetical protein
MYCSNSSYNAILLIPIVWPLSCIQQPSNSMSNDYIQETAGRLMREEGWTWRNQAAILAQVYVVFFSGFLFSFWRDLPAISTVLGCFVNIQDSHRQELPHIALIDIWGELLSGINSTENDPHPLKMHRSLEVPHPTPDFLRLAGTLNVSNISTHRRTLIIEAIYSYNQRYQHSYCWIR